LAMFFFAYLAATENFYTDVLGFSVSDRYPGVGTFLRCSTPGGHHSLLLLETPDKKVGLNHVAYTVRDIHEVFGRGLQIDPCGWNPAGALVEYFTDEDYYTEKWQSHDFERSNEAYTEWIVVGGINFSTRRQRIISE
jgi:catechol 2,3-dioxygenase-like lactoylglutathione lyase family enzyme